MTVFVNRGGRFKKKVVSDSPRGATLLSMRQNLTYQASIAIQDIERTMLDLPKAELANVNRQIKQLLDKEFGSLRVRKHRYGFAVGCTDEEVLIAALLRVQYHANQMETTPIVSEVFDTSFGVPVTWGVGEDILEADANRSKRKEVRRSTRVLEHAEPVSD